MKTKPYKSIIATIGSFVTAIAVVWPSGSDVTLREGLTAVVVSLLTGGVTWAKSNPIVEP